MNTNKTANNAAVNTANNVATDGVVIYSGYVAPSADSDAEVDVKALKAFLGEASESFRATEEERKKATEYKVTNEELEELAEKAAADSVKGMTAGKNAVKNYKGIETFYLHKRENDTLNAKINSGKYIEFADEALSHFVDSDTFSLWVAQEKNLQKERVEKALHMKKAKNPVEERMKIAQKAAKAGDWKQARQVIENTYDVKFNNPSWERLKSALQEDKNGKTKGVKTPTKFASTVHARIRAFHIVNDKANKIGVRISYNTIKSVVLEVRSHAEFYNEEVYDFDKLSKKAKNLGYNGTNDPAEMRKYLESVTVQRPSFIYSVEYNEARQKLADALTSRIKEVNNVTADAEATTATKEAE